MTHPTLSAALVLSVLAACAPIRPSAEGSEGAGLNSLESAVFVWWDYGTYKSGRLILVDQEYSCDTFRSVGWYLNSTSLPADVAWVSIDVLLGANQGDWAGEFQSYYLWSLAGNWDYASARFVSGSWGVGGPDVWGDDDVVVGRQTLGQLGQDQAHSADALVLDGWDAEHVRGTMIGIDGEWDLDATNCGNANNLVGTPPDGGGGGDAPTEPAL